ncbi:MAG TPA: hypothetical protein VFN87_00320, partial [Solirubrobacteraceae bacterium]|nr:hypothetical protein [Solirubrobacteraceae bacterium]
VSPRTSVALSAGRRRSVTPRRTPVILPPPPVSSPRTIPQAQPVTSLPVGLALLALAAVGLLAAADGYRKTRRRLRAGRPGQPPHGNLRARGGAR